MSTQESLIEILKEIQVGIQTIAAIYAENTEEMEVSTKKQKDIENRKQLESNQEKQILELLKKKYIVTRHPKDSVAVSELTRYLILQTEDFTPRQCDRVLGRLFKSYTKKVNGKNIKMKLGIKGNT